MDSDGKVKSYTWKAFENLPLKKLDLSNQNITQLPSKVCKNLLNITEIGKPSYKRKEIGSIFSKGTNLFFVAPVRGKRLKLSLLSYIWRLPLIDLSFNKLASLKDDIFYNVPELLLLQMKNNLICNIAKVLDHIGNSPDLVVDLSHNNLKYFAGK